MNEKEKLINEIIETKKNIFPVINYEDEIKLKDLTIEQLKEELSLQKKILEKQQKLDEEIENLTLEKIPEDDLNKNLLDDLFNEHDFDDDFDDDDFDDLDNDLF